MLIEKEYWQKIDTCREKERERERERKRERYRDNVFNVSISTINYELTLKECSKRARGRSVECRDSMIEEKRQKSNVSEYLNNDSLTC